MIGARAVWELPEDKAKRTGMARAASAHHTDLRIARDIARELAAGGKQVSADDVRAALAERHPDITGPFDFMGSCFRGKEWIPIGFTKSRTPGSHSNRLLIYRLKEQA